MNEFTRKENSLSVENTSLSTQQQNSISALTQVNQARAIEELRSMMTIAKQFPRNLAEVEDKIIANCSRVGLAKKAIYSYIRSGSEIAGATIRLAEVLKSCMGNLTTDTKEEFINATTSRGYATCHDLENNTKSTREFVVVYERNAGGITKPILDPRDRREHFYSIASRHLRNMILEQVPTDFIELALSVCKKTLVNNIKTDKDAQLNTLKAFKEYGVTRKMLEVKLGGRKFESITPIQMADLRSIYVSLKDGLGKPSDFFKMDLADDEAEKPKELKKPKSKNKVETKIKETETNKDYVPTVDEIADQYDIPEDVF